MDDAPKQDPAWEEADFEAQIAAITDEKALKHIKLARGAFNTLRATAVQEEGWKLSQTKHGVQVFSAKGEEGISRIKGKGDIPYSIKEFLWDMDEKKKYDKDLETSKEIQELPLKISVGYSAYKGKMLASGRDFLYVTYVSKNTDGTLVIASTSTEHEGCPPVKKYVRAHTIIAGWVLTPDAETPDTLTHCTYISSSNLKGSLPKMITNSVAKNQGFKIQTIREAMQKKFK